MKFFATVVLAALAFTSSAIKIGAHEQALPNPTPNNPNGVTVVQPATNPNAQPAQPTIQPVPVAPQPTVVQPTPVQPAPVQPAPATNPAETKPNGQAPQKATEGWTDADEKEFANWEKNLIPVTIPALQDKIKELVNQEK